MTLKALLMGSAAAMIAVSGAKAADAVVAEPEAVEYVKVCDTYGTGFYYIPGTETCLNINGYVRVDYSYNNRAIAATNTSAFTTVVTGADAPAGGVIVATDANGLDVYAVGTRNPAGNDGSTWEYRARINFDARNETDYGTLRSQLRIQGDGDGGGDADAGIDRALISLNGLRLGYSDSYTTTLHGYGHQGIEKYDGIYFYDQAIMADYTYSANGFSATVGAQDSTGASGVATNNNVDLEFYVGASYSNSTFTLAASYLYETEAEEGSYKVSAVVTPIEGFSVKGWFVGDSGTTRTLGAVAASGFAEADYAWGIGANYQATDTLSLAAAFSDADNNEYAITVGAIWDVAPGMSVRPNVQFREDSGESYSLRVYRSF